MQLPLQITFRNLAHSEGLDKLIRERVEWLETFHSHVMSCRVVVEHTGDHQGGGKQFFVRINLKVPGAEIAIDHPHDEDVHVAVRDAFDAARRQLEDQLRLQRGQVKLHRA